VNLRALLVAVVATVALGWLTTVAPVVSRDAVTAAAPGGSLDALCGAVALVLAWGLSAWLTLAVLAAVGATLPGVIGDRLRLIATRLAPVTVRRAVALAIGISVVGPVATSHAAPVPEPRYPVLDRVVVQPAPAAPYAPLTQAEPPLAPSLDPSGVEAAQPGPATADSADIEGPADTVIVQPGDSLWRIAAAALGPDASAAEIAAAWPRWYAANRATVGADPGLIHPGQRLHPPAAAATASGSTVQNGAP
jgi:nucleoid-associated protein YgaU